MYYNSYYLPLRVFLQYILHCHAICATMQKFTACLSLTMEVSGCIFLYCICKMCTCLSIKGLILTDYSRHLLEIENEKRKQFNLWCPSLCLSPNTLMWASWLRCWWMRLERTLRVYLHLGSLDLSLFRCLSLLFPPRHPQARWVRVLFADITYFIHPHITLISDLTDKHYYILF